MIKGATSIPKFPMNISNNINIVDNIRNIVYKPTQSNTEVKDKSSPNKSRLQNNQSKNNFKQEITTTKSNKGIHSRAVSDLVPHMGNPSSTARLETNCTFIKSTTIISKIKGNPLRAESETERGISSSKKIFKNV